MMRLTDDQRGRMSGLMRHERAMLRAHVPGKAQRQMLISTSPQPTLLKASLISVYRRRSSRLSSVPAPQ